MAIISKQKIFIRHILTFVFSMLIANYSWAQDIYNASNNQLSIPKVQVQDTLYSDVVITVGGVVKVVGGMPAGAIDTYASDTNQLTIPVVIVGGTQYTNVVITVGSVVSVGGASKIVTAAGTNSQSVTVVGYLVF